MHFSFKAFAARRTLVVSALLGGTLAVPAAALIAAGGDSEPRAVRVPIDPTPAEAQATAAKASPAHEHDRLMSAYGAQAAARGLRGGLDAEGAPAPFRSARTSELDCLTQAVYFEARGETADGQAAVAQVVLNRVRHPAFPKTVCGVVYQGVRNRGCQFSFACDGSVRRGRETSAWNRAHRVAARALAGAVMPEVGAATHFHAVRVAPAWGPGMKRVAQVGLHVFYRFSHGPRLADAPRPAPALAEPEGEVILTGLAVQPQVQVETADAMPAEVPAADAAAQTPAAETAKPAAVS